MMEWLIPFLNFLWIIIKRIIFINVMIALLCIIFFIIVLICYRKNNRSDKNDS